MKTHIMMGQAFSVSSIALLCFAVGCHGQGPDPIPLKEPTQEAPMKSIARHAHGAGRWFPSDPLELRVMVRDFIRNARVPKINGRIVAAIAPHAGYPYSGNVAGHTFRALQENAAIHPPETVVILGFSHRAAFRGVALLDGDVFRTPLGDTPFDRDAIRTLAESGPRLTLNSEPHVGEHSAENEIPFAQIALPKAKLVVALIGDHDPQTIADLVAALVRLARTKQIVVVASTDLLHDPDYDRVTQTDKETLDTIVRMDHTSLARSWTPTGQLCCGIGPVIAAIRFAQDQGAKSGRLLLYRNSGDEDPRGRGTWVVGYGAVVFPLEE